MRNIYAYIDGRESVRALLHSGTFAFCVRASERSFALEVCARTCSSVKYRQSCTRYRAPTKSELSSKCQAEAPGDFPIYVCMKQNTYYVTVWNTAVIVYLSIPSHMYAYTIIYKPPTFKGGEATFDFRFILKGTLALCCAAVLLWAPARYVEKGHLLPYRTCKGLSTLQPTRSRAAEDDRPRHLEIFALYVDRLVGAVGVWRGLT